MDKKKVAIIKDADGKSIVVINDLRFKGRRSVDWNIVEVCLKEYIGECVEITETSDVIYRYDTRFAIPVYDDAGKLFRFIQTL